MKPYIHKLRTKNNNYIYDVWTNEILKVDDVTYDIIDVIYSKRENDIINIYRNKYKESDIIRSLNEIKIAINKENLFSRIKKRKLVFYNNMEIKEKCNNGLSHLILNVTEQCNLRCKYCIYSGNYYYERKHSTNKMSSEIALKSIDFFFEHNKKANDIIIGFYGGEPLINIKLIKECVEYAKAKNKNKKMFFTITSNGTLFNDNIIDFLINNKIGLAISLDGPKEIHDRYRVNHNGNGTYDIIKNNLCKIKEINNDYYNNYIVFNMVITSYNDISKIEQFVNENEEIFDKNILLINYVVQFNNYLYNKNILNKLIFNKSELLSKYITSIIEKKENKFLSYLLNKDYVKFHYRKRYKVIGDEILLTHLCVPGGTKLVVNYDGEFHFCTNLCSNMSIGNIYSGLNHYKIINILSEFINICEKDCYKCWAIRLCDACFITAAKGEIFSIKQKRRVCIGIRNEIKNILVSYNEAIEKKEDIFEILNYDENKKRIWES